MSKPKETCEDCRFAKREPKLDYATHKGFYAECYKCLFSPGSNDIKTSKDSCEHFEAIPEIVPKKKCKSKVTVPKRSKTTFLLPCPFCGSDDISDSQNSYGNSVMTVVKCRKCNASGSPIWSDATKIIRDVDIEEAYLRWNERVGSCPQDWLDAIADGTVTLKSQGENNGKH